MFNESAEFSGVTIERCIELNQNRNVTPWIGVYQGKVDYDPRTLGKNGKSFTATLEPIIVVQISSLLSGADCADLLEDYVKKVLETVWENYTMNGTVDMLNSIAVKYTYIRTDIESMYYQEAEIVLNLEVATG